MKIACVQMDVTLGMPGENFAKAVRLIEEAMEGAPDIVVLPETWNTGFFPKEGLSELSDRDCARVKAEIGALARKFRVNIVAGSVANVRDGKVYNTACVFDREGSCIGSYDKTHLFTPMGEEQYFAKGDHLCRFTLDGVRCGILICYDLRFPELSRSLALQGLDMLFVVSQWPKARVPHLQTLTAARAIENQVFLVCCNACGTAGDTRFGGSSCILDPLGNPIARAGETEQILTGECDLQIVTSIRGSIHVFRDRRPELYRC